MIVLVRYFSLFLPLYFLLASCAESPPPTAQIVEVTREVPVTVEVTRVVEQPIIQTVEIILSPIPQPTPTPTAFDWELDVTGTYLG